MFLDVTPAYADHVPPVPVAPNGLLPSIPPPPVDLHAFGIHWSTVVGILVLAALYVYAIGPWRRRHRAAIGVSRARTAAFFGGLVALFFSLNGPLHELSDTYLFSAHMVQHLLLSQLVAPLLIIGLPAWMLLPLLARLRLHGAAHRLTRPWTALAIYTTVFILWHLPPLFNRMMAQHPVHIAMHVSILAVSVLSWWPVFGDPEALPTPSPLLSILHAFLLSVPMMAVAAFITYSDQILYPWYSVAPRVWGISVHDDQVAGGAIMWVPGTAVYWMAMTWVWFRWARREGADRETEVLRMPEAPALPLTHRGG